MDWPIGVRMPGAVREYVRRYQHVPRTQMTTRGVSRCCIMADAAIEALVELWQTDRASLGVALDHANEWMLCAQRNADRSEKAEEQLGDCAKSAGGLEYRLEQAEAENERMGWMRESDDTCRVCGIEKRGTCHAWYEARIDELKAERDRLKAENERLRGWDNVWRERVDKAEAETDRLKIKAKRLRSALQDIAGGAWNVRHGGGNLSALQFAAKMLREEAHYD